MKTKINIDRVRICLQQPADFFDYLYGLFQKSPDKKVHYDGFFLMAADNVQVNDKDITVTLYLEDNSPIELGKFVFNKSQKYGSMCFFTYATKCLYETSAVVNEGEDKGIVKYNYFNYPFFVFSQLGLVFNSITSIEIACDTEVNIINKIQYAVSKPELFYMILMGKNVIDPEQPLEGFYEYYQRSRLRKASHPTLYIHPTLSLSGNKCELKAYDKARELAQSRQDKNVLTRAWNDMGGNIYRLEITVENKKFRQFFMKMCKIYPDRWLHNDAYSAKTKERRNQLYKEAIEHFFFDLGMNESLRYEMFDYFASNLLHFKLHNRQKTQISILDLSVNSTTVLKGSVKRKRVKQSKKTS